MDDKLATESVARLKGCVCKHADLQRRLAGIEKTSESAVAGVMVVEHLLTQAMQNLCQVQTNFGHSPAAVALLGDFLGNDSMTSIAEVVADDIAFLPSAYDCSLECVVQVELGKGLADLETAEYLLTRAEQSLSDLEGSTAE